MRCPYTRDTLWQKGTGCSSHCTLGRFARLPGILRERNHSDIHLGAFALLHRCQVAVVFALGAMQAVLAGIAVVWTSDTHPPHFSFSIFKVASWACLCAPLVVSEILGGLALQAPIPFTLGAVLCTKLAHATNTVGPRKIEEAVWTGRFTLAIGCEEQTILALAAPGLIGTLTAARFAGYTFSI